ncbi:hypothetical protein F5887DRAFT_1159170 [Amanita rubescens]|nr:hypothetical protein F5887DRAFT_1159170 [Amanita rubescens]
MADSCTAPDRARCQPSDLTHAAELPDLHSRPSQLAHIVKFEFCSADSCPMRSTERTHLLVSKSQIDLFKAKNAAVALSYTWGQFEHTQRLIGHAVDGEPVSLILGAEWDTEDITSSLVRLSFEHGGCWMDQLCMPQKGTEARRALASIPLIYRSLDVVVLLPGAPCKCLQESLGMLKIAEDFGTQKDFETALHTALQQINHCLNSIPSCSWFKRLWTRQEMLYSARISVAWTRLGTSQCVKVPDVPSEYTCSLRIPLEQISNLTPFARLLYQRASKENYDKLFGHTGWAALKHAFQIRTPHAFANSIVGLTDALVNKLSSLRISENEAGRRLRRRITEGRETIERARTQWAHLSNMSGEVAVEVDHTLFVCEAIDAFRDYMSKNEASDDDFLAILRFFSGESMTNTAMKLDTQDKEGRLTRFLKSLGALRSSGRSCTQPRDYINSIWVDCPGFQIPKFHTEMKLSALLEDALDQLRSNHGVDIVTSAPSGLFSAMSSTGLWKPSLCLRDKVENVGQVYQPMILPVNKMPVTKEGMIPLRLTGKGLSSLSITAFDYEREWSRRPTMFIFNEMINIMQWWPADVLGRLVKTEAVNEICRKIEATDTTGPTLIGRALAGSAWAAVSNVGRSYNASQNAMAARMERRSEELDDYTATRRDSMNFCSKLMQAVENRRRAMPDSEHWTSQRELKHTEIVYSMVADAMGLDYDICRQHSLKLMVSRDPPCIGLTNQDILVIQKRQQAKKGAIRTVHVSTGDTGIVLYEVKGNPKTEKYCVFGAWVPITMMKSMIDDRVYAVATKEVTDAFIV